ncbi:MAG TPA: roadblock/LC7 domain-containing protein [Tepidiformaceae bacterium]|jgi:predicted regulator of Ras-like GTPase activity (Roadblock/LC7/MglB family)|nr:roadblock/LC7 domain-containing protein [Thermoflexaceae bacterium]HMS58185.1 roadblock/LC7 domain-containing protein [Tepidiformaceae bacterium]
MEEDLQQIAGIANVAGAFVCDNGGEVIASSEPPVLATVAMASLGKEAARAFSALEAAGTRASRVEFEFDTWRLVARDLGEGLLLVVCRPGVDSALLRMSADIAIAAWKADSRSQKRLTKRKAQRSQLLAQSQLDAPAWTSWRLLESRG